MLLALAPEPRALGHSVPPQDRAGRLQSEGLALCMGRKLRLSLRKKNAQNARFQARGPGDLGLLGSSWVG